MTAPLAVRQAAKVSGEKRYNGRACPTCDSTERWVSNGACVLCERARLRSPEHRARTRSWYSRNSARHKALRDQYRSEHKAEIHAYNDAWRRANLKRMCAHIQAYNAQKKRAMPPWADREAIQRIYENCPEGHQVDHTIPLRGRLVSGLHVEGNLQYLPGLENNVKGNSYVAT